MFPPKLYTILGGSEIIIRRLKAIRLILIGLKLYIFKTLFTM